MSKRVFLLHLCKNTSYLDLNSLKRKMNINYEQFVILIYSTIFFVIIEKYFYLNKLFFSAFLLNKITKFKL